MDPLIKRKYERNTRNFNETVQSIKNPKKFVADPKYHLTMRAFDPIYSNIPEICRNIPIYNKIKGLMYQPNKLDKFVPNEIKRGLKVLYQNNMQFQQKLKYLFWASAN